MKDSKGQVERTRNISNSNKLREKQLHCLFYETHRVYTTKFRYKFTKEYYGFYYGFYICIHKYTDDFESLKVERSCPESPGLSRAQLWVFLLANTVALSFPHRTDRQDSTCVCSENIEIISKQIR